MSVRGNYEREIDSSFLKDDLMPGENVVFNTTVSPVLYFLPTMFVIVGFGMFGFSKWIALLAIAIGAFHFVSTFLNIKSSIYAVTNKRVVIKTGFIRRDSLDISINRIEGVSLEQNIAGRIFNFGNVYINGVGGDKAKAEFVGDPVGFKRSIQEVLNDGYTNGGK
jgi:uncharacterized membrane protein YdbT with pleckstrin-like domain